VLQRSAVKIMDTTFRDAHQSLHATRLKLEDIAPIAKNEGRLPNLYWAWLR